jgi:oligopeptide transport system substrate-binding protein
MNTTQWIRRAAVLVLGIIVSFSLFAGGGTETADDVPTLNLTLTGDPQIIDPTTNWTYDIQANMFVPLVGYNYEVAEVYPRGATSWDVSADGLTWTFDIRQDWMWSDGNPVTAEDYAYSFRRIADPETAAPMSYRLAALKNGEAVIAGDAPVSDLGVTVIDDYTLQIELEFPAAWFLLSLTSIGHAVPSWTIEEFGEDWTQPENIVTNGPYILTAWEIDNYVTLEKNPSYYDADEVQIEVINGLVVPAESTAMAMYENGELDYAVVPSEDLDRVRSDPVLSQEFRSISQYNLYMYQFNVIDPPFNDVLVRKAFAAATDKETLVSSITRDGATILRTATPPGSVGAVDPSSEIGIDFDPEQAAAWLAEAGYPGGEGLPTIVLGYNASERHANIAQAVQKMWGDYLGANVELAAWEGAGYGPAAYGGEFNVYRWGWGMDYPDANNIHGGLFHSRLGHDVILKNSEYDSLVDRAARETDVSVREDLYARAEEILVEEEVGIIPFFASSSNIVVKPYLDRILVPSYVQEFWLWEINK